MTDYTSKDVIDRQNNTPNAGCMIDGVFYDVRNLIHERDQARAEAAAAYEKIARAAENRAWSVGLAGHEIRALATEPGTTDLAEMLDAETRACGKLCDHFLFPEDVKDAILARINQRKENKT